MKKQSRWSRKQAWSQKKEVGPEVEKYVEAEMIMFWIGSVPVSWKQKEEEAVHWRFLSPSEMYEIVKEKVGDGLVK